MPEVVVVGGGATGVGVARDLALRGVDVTLLEREAIAAGTSGRMHGLLHSGARYAVSDPHSARECRRESQTLREIASHCVVDTGGLFVSLPGDPAHVDTLVEACRAAAIPVETWSGERAHDAEAHLSPAVERAVRVPDGVVRPVKLCLATALDAERAGATVRTGVGVASLYTAGGRVQGVELAGGERVAADHVVNAAGPLAGRLAATAGVEFELAPSRGVMVVVDGPPVERVLNRCRPRSEGDIVVPVDGEPVLGTTDRPVADPEQYDRERAEVEAVCDSLAAVVPDVAGATVRAAYWGVRPLVDAGSDPTEAERGFTVHTERGLTSVAGGKLTTHRLMAESVADGVCERLGVTAGSETATRPLPRGEALSTAVRRWAPDSPVPGTPSG